VNVLALLQSVTWIRVEKPVFDLWGVLTSSLSMAGICAALALALGSLLGLWLIRRRRADLGPASRLLLHLER
jgi:hypothetical protein